ncbi:MAG: hypothetical protein FJ087_15770 [Deltaproteobacteria bacterium]|nr:hypothetical protein [Deltaproteobacteria bacterium]
MGKRTRGSAGLSFGSARPTNQAGRIPALQDLCGIGPEAWLWCLHCERFFQAKDLQPDGVGGVQACAFDDCDGAGVHVDIFEWDSWARQNPSDCGRWWPKSTNELVKGMRCSLDPEPEDCV